MIGSLGAMWIGRRPQDEVGRQNSIPPLNWLLTLPVKLSNMMREANRMRVYQMLFLDIKSSATCRLLPTLSSLILSVPSKFLLNFHKSFSRSSNFLNLAKMCYPKGLTENFFFRLVWWKSTVEIMFYWKRGILMTFFLNLPPKKNFLTVYWNPVELTILW